MKFTKEQIAFQDIWKTAYAQGKVEFELPSLADARRIRFGLYNAARPFREGKLFNEEIKQAAEECSVRVTPVPGSAKVLVSVEAKMKSEVMQTVLAALGKTEADLNMQPKVKTAEEVEIEESQKRLLEKLGQVSPGGGGNMNETPAGARVTPYYTR